MAGFKFAVLDKSAFFKIKVHLHYVKSALASYTLKTITLVGKYLSMHFKRIYYVPIRIGYYYMSKKYSFICNLLYKMGNYFLDL